jgi:hypothetical protein
VKHGLGWELRLHVNESCILSSLVESLEESATLSTEWKVAMLTRGWETGVESPMPLQPNG